VPPKDAFDVVRKAVGSVEQSDNRLKMDEQARTIARGVDRKGLEMQQIRRWNVGDVYAPHDLSGAEQSKWKRMKQSPRPKWDVLDQLNLNPMDHYKVSSC
jgi:small subunit ribosomal protein S18